MKKSKVRTRIAASPTGIAHVGTAYIALFNYVFAKKYHGEFIIRIEDTDRRRFVQGAEEILYKALSWLGIPHGEGVDVGGPYAPYRQSERLELYHQYAEELLQKKHAYYCFCTPDELQIMRKEQQKQGKLPMYDGRCKLLDPQTAKERAKKEQCVIRLNMPDTGKTAWQDLIRGHIEFDNMLVDDQVLVKSDGFPTYHLAVVVDDHFMKITHVLRGEEWISSTPKHLVLYDFFGWEKPMFAHMPLLRNPDHSKLSKRKNDVSLISYMKQGYLPEALLNFLCLLGWSHPKGEEIFSLENFLEHFSIERMQKTGPVFDFNKLKWMNGVYIREKISLEDLTNRLTPHIPKEFPQDKLSAVLVLIRERLVVLSDFASLTDFLYSDVTVDKSALQIKKADDQLIQKQLTQTIASIQNITQWNHEIIETAMRTLQENQDWKRSQYFMMIRIAVTGKTATPPLFETMQLIGKEKILERLKKAQSVF